VVKQLNVGAAFLISVPAQNLLYASIPAGVTENPNTVIPIDPVTATTKTPIPVGNDPRQITASDDGKYLYVEARGDQTIQRVNLDTLTVEKTFPFPPATQIGAFSPLRVAEMHTVPSSPKSLVISVQGSSGLGMMALYNDGGLVNAIPASYPGVEVNSFAFTDTASIYGLPFTYAQNHYFKLFSIDGSGIHDNTPPTSNYGSYDQTGAQVVTDGTLLYTSAGQVWNPASQQLAGTFDVQTYNKTSYPNIFNLAIDTGHRQLYVIGDQPDGPGSSAMTLTSYDANSLQTAASLTFPMWEPTAYNLSRWGENGFAFLATPGTAPLQNAVYLVRSDSVLGRTAAAAWVSTNSLTFGSQEAGTASAAQTIILMNTGAAALAVSGVNVTGDFVATHSCTTPLAEGASCQISVKFSPASSGSRTGTLSIASNASAGPTVITLTGTATPAVITIGAAPGGSTSATVTNGLSATYNLSMTGSAGVSGAVSLTCSNVPQYATCTINPPSVSLSSGGTASFTVTIATQTMISSIAPAQRGSSLAALGFATLCAMPIALLALPKRNYAVKILIFLIAVIVLYGSSCGGEGSSGPAPPRTYKTPPGTYTVKITATSSTASSQQDLTLIVQ
jgi:hypothetical protein